MSKRGNILTENLVFIILNLVFIAIIILFIFSKMSDTSLIEERYAKQLALGIDAAKPAMTISYDMTEAYSKIEGIEFKDVLSIDNENNLIIVRLNQGSGYTYSFFNDLYVTAYPDSEKEGYYFITISKNE